MKAAARGIIVWCSLAVFSASYAEEKKPADPPVATFSIVARDPNTGELGVAVQSLPKTSMECWTTFSIRKSPESPPATLLPGGFQLKWGLYDSLGVRSKPDQLWLGASRYRS